MTQQIAVISHKANEVDLLKITIEIMKNKISNLEDAAAPPALSSSHASTSPRGHSAHSAQPSHTIPPFHEMVDVPHTRTSQALQRVVPTRSQPRRATVNVRTKRTHPNHTSSTQATVGQLVRTAKRPKLAPVEPSATHAGSQAHSTTTITESILHSQHSDAALSPYSTQDAPSDDS